MTVWHNHNAEDPFIRIHKAVVMDNRISWKAKGILMYAFSRPPGWKFNKNEIIKHSLDGEKSFDSGIKELEKCGYLYRRGVKVDNNLIQGWEWNFFGKPITLGEFQKKFSDSAVLGEARFGGGPKRSPNKNNSNKNEESKNDMKKSIPKGIPKKTPVFIHEQREDTIEIREYVHLSKKQIESLKERYSEDMLDIMVDKLNYQHEQILQGLSKKKQPYTFSVFNKNVWLWEAADKQVNSPTAHRSAMKDFKTIVKEKFRNAKEYNQAEFSMDEVYCGFHRGSHQRQVRWNDYEFEGKFNNMLKEFGVVWGG